YSQHQKLIDLSLKIVNLRSNETQVMNQISNLKAQQQLIEESINRVKQFRALTKKLHACQRKKPWLAYEKERTKWLLLKEERDIAKNNLKSALTGKNSEGILHRINN